MTECLLKFEGWSLWEHAYSNLLRFHVYISVAKFNSNKGQKFHWVEI